VAAPTERESAWRRTDASPEQKVMNLDRFDLLNRSTVRRAGVATV
jgi:hypothetical protein